MAIIDKNNLSDILKIEILYNPEILHAIKESLVWGFCVFFILFVFRPYGISDENITYLFFVCSGLSFITFIVFFFNTWHTKSKLYLLFNKSWKIYSELLFFVIVLPQVCFLNYIFSGLSNLLSFSVVDSLSITVYTSTLLTIIFLFKSVMTLNRRYHEEILKLNTKIDYYNELELLKNINSGCDKQIKLHFNNEILDLQINKVVLISAWGNYIKILIKTDKKNVELVRRGKIKDIWEQLSTYPEFYRCHRSYIVNIKYIKTVAGNTKKADLILLDEDGRIPISREQISRLTKIHSGLKKNT